MEGCDNTVEASMAGLMTQMADAMGAVHAAAIPMNDLQSKAKVIASLSKAEGTMKELQTAVAAGNQRVREAEEAQCRAESKLKKAQQTVGQASTAKKQAREELQERRLSISRSRSPSLAESEAVGESQSPPTLRRRKSCAPTLELQRKAAAAEKHGLELANDLLRTHQKLSASERALTETKKELAVKAQEHEEVVRALAEATQANEQETEEKEKAHAEYKQTMQDLAKEHEEAVYALADATKAIKTESEEKEKTRMEYEKAIRDLAEKTEEHQKAVCAWAKATEANEMETKEKEKTQAMLVEKTEEANESKNVAEEIRATMARMREEVQRQEEDTQEVQSRQAATLNQLAEQCERYNRASWELSQRTAAYESLEQDFAQLTKAHERALSVINQSSKRDAEQAVQATNPSPISPHASKAEQRAAAAEEAMRHAQGRAAAAEVARRDAEERYVGLQRLMAREEKSRSTQQERQLAQQLLERTEAYERVVEQLRHQELSSQRMAEELGWKEQAHSALLQELSERTTDPRGDQIALAEVMTAKERLEGQISDVSAQLAESKKALDEAQRAAAHQGDARERLAGQVTRERGLHTVTVPQDMEADKPVSPSLKVPTQTEPRSPAGPQPMQQPPWSHLVSSSLSPRGGGWHPGPQWQQTSLMDVKREYSMSRSAEQSTSPTPERTATQDLSDYYSPGRARSQLLRMHM